MSKEKLYRIKPELREYLTEDYRDLKARLEWWDGGLFERSALEEVEDTPKITHICLVSSYGSGFSGATMTFVVNFNGVLGEDWNEKQRKAVETKILGTISPLLVGKTWDELAEEGGEGIG